MKRWLYLLGALILVGILSRLPHPARDIAKLDPVRAVYLYMEEGKLCIETDTGAAGSGRDLAEAAEQMKAAASAEIFLETAEYVILDPSVVVTEEFYRLLRPACRVCHSEARPDLEQAAQFLSVHEPERTLAHIRAEEEQNHDP